ncbi:MAG: ATP-binding protein [bacterium]
MNRLLIIATACAWLVLGALGALLLPPSRGLAVALLCWFGLGALLVGLLFRSVDRRLADTARAFERFGEGDFGARLDPGPHPVLRRLAHVFNESAFRTGELVRRLEAQRETFEATITAMRDGVLVVDRLGRITLANAAFSDLCGRSDAVGLFHWEAIRDPGLAETVRSAGTAAGAAPRQLDLDGRTWLCAAARLERTDSVLVTFHDVTDLQRVLQMKRDFVRNVAHELRTPLTAIKGFVETMEESVSDANRRPLEIVGRHTDRLVAIVGDLARLTELEDAAAPPPRFEPVALDAVVESVAALFERRCRDKGIELRVELEPGLPPVPGDRVKLEQVLVNLLDNAVNYTDKGSVTVRLRRDAGRAALEVLDTGIGIERRDIERIFERFYVADKSRSRLAGGTGLGLAIVKHIVSLHSGEVAVQSTPGKGSTFTVTLPTAG